MTHSITDRQIVDALARIACSHISWNGFNLHGDSKSISQADRLIHVGDQIDEYRSAFDNRSAALKARADALSDALGEVMSWIENWSPAFLQDDEWLATKTRVDAALEAKR